MLETPRLTVPPSPPPYELSHLHTSAPAVLTACLAPSGSALLGTSPFFCRALPGWIPLFPVCPLSLCSLWEPGAPTRRFHSYWTYGLDRVGPSLQLQGPHPGLGCWGRWRTLSQCLWSETDPGRGQGSVTHSPSLKELLADPVFKGCGCPHKQA